MIELQSLTKRFGEYAAVNAVDLHVKSGELIALLGPSGSGKTTLLRMIAGLETPTDGRILFSGDDATRRHVRERGVGFVFQHYALFKHMTVAQNVGFGLRVRARKSRPPRAEISARVQELLRLVQLEHYGERYPSQLSGGQRQRVALARALAVEPRILLLDEPFGALDAKVRVELRRWLRRLHDQMHVTSVFVTHDQEEAMEVADRVVIMRAGRVEQVGTPNDVYEHPRTPFVYDFLGNVNIFKGRVRAGEVHLECPVEASSRESHVNGSGSNGTYKPHHNAGGVATGGGGAEDDSVLFIRPHMLDIDPQPRNPFAMRACVRRVNAFGSSIRVILLTDSGAEISADLSRERFEALRPRPDQVLYISARDARAFPKADVHASIGEGI